MHMVALCLMAAAVTAAEPDAVVLEFTAPDRCPPCQQIAPLVHRLQREGYPIQIVNSDENVFVCQQHRIVSIPTFVLKIAGREVDRIEGKPPEAELRRMCERARLANAASAVKTETPPATAEQRATRPAPAKPATIDTKDADPVIRAKHDDSANLPNATSTDPLHVCPRIRVKDSLGVNFGTGTIIDSREGRTTILTCGHLFRQLDDKSVIEVDVFNGSKHETFVGRVLKYDLEADIGLLWIPTTRVLPVAAIAGLANAPAAGQHVFSVGCSGGEPPSKLQHRVTVLNRYLGPDNVECTGVPVQGRSGGGLFDTAGRLIGVCIAADQRDQRGLYAGLKPIHELLNEQKLSHLHPRTESRPSAESLASRTPIGKSAPAKDLPIVEESILDSEPSLFGNEVVSPFALSKNVTEAEHSEPAATKESIAPRFAAAAVDLTEEAAMKTPEAGAPFDPNNESEVVCIIRPLNNPRAASRVVIINRASSKFLSQLSGELEQQATPTSAIVREAKYAIPTIRPYRRTRESVGPIGKPM